MNGIVRNGIGALAASLIVAWQGVALGSSLEGAGGPGQVRVSYADLDLSRSADVAVLYRRIQRAAELACGERTFTGSHLELPSWKLCVSSAINVAVGQVEVPALDAYHRDHAGEPDRRG